MSLLRLLTAGKSLVGLKDYQSRYVTRGGLPKFGSKKNPFRATARPEAAPSRVSARDFTSGPQLAVRAEPEIAPAREVLAAADAVRAESTNEEANTVTPAEKGTLQPCAGAPDATISKPRSVRGEKGWKWGKMAFWKRPGPARQAPAAMPKPMLQGELSLDGVRVVRNDLSDTDLEVVPCKPVVAPAVTAAPPPAAPPATASAPGTAWGRVTGRLFGAGKV